MGQSFVLPRAAQWTWIGSVRTPTGTTTTTACFICLAARTRPAVAVKPGRRTCGSGPARHARRHSRPRPQSRLKTSKPGKECRIPGEGDDKNTGQDKPARPSTAAPLALTLPGAVANPDKDTGVPPPPKVDPQAAMGMFSQFMSWVSAGRGPWSSQQTGTPPLWTFPHTAQRSSTVTRPSEPEGTRSQPPALLPGAAQAPPDITYPDSPVVIELGVSTEWDSF